MVAGRRLAGVAVVEHHVRAVVVSDGVVTASALGRYGKVRLPKSVVDDPVARAGQANENTVGAVRVVTPTPVPADAVVEQITLNLAVVERVTPHDAPTGEGELTIQNPAVDNPTYKNVVAAGGGSRAGVGKAQTAKPAVAQEVLSFHCLRQIGRRKAHRNWWPERDIGLPVSAQRRHKHKLLMRPPTGVIGKSGVVC